MRHFIPLLLLCPLIGCDAAQMYGEQAAEPVLEPVVDPVASAVADAFKEQKQFSLCLHNWDEHPVILRARWVIIEGTVKGN